MNLLDAITYGLNDLLRHKVRSALITIAMSVGVAAIIMLSALGEGARLYVLGEFASLGTNIIIIMPGKNDTTGGAPPMTGEITRDLTLEDAQAISRLPGVSTAAPIIIGGADLSYLGKEREVVVLGTTAEYAQVRPTPLSGGHFLPSSEWDMTSSVAIIGKKIQTELFAGTNPIGEAVRVADRRFRVIGNVASKGQDLILDMDEVVIIPVASAQQLFNRRSLFRILVATKSRANIKATQKAIIQLIKQRHDGEEDVTVITQDAVLGTFDKIISALTAAVAGIGAISVLVAGILIMNVTLVTVSQRTAEIGLLKALGAAPQQIRNLILLEAVLLSLFGATTGLIIGYAAVYIGDQLYPKVELTAPNWAGISALLVALLAGAIFAILPAKKAAALDPVLALAKR